jgi:uncharacterized DUF497 family protein
MANLSLVIGFEWDGGNERKSPDRHDVRQAEAEQTFSDQHLLVNMDDRHSLREIRWHALGRTDAGRFLHVTFTLRHGGTKIRIISARDMHKKERQKYEAED